MAHYHNRPSIRQLRELGMTQKDFADRIRKTRERNNLSLQQLGAELGVTGPSVGRWQRGDHLPGSGLDPEFVLELLGQIDKKYGGGENDKRQLGEA